MIANENIQDKALENFKANQTEVTVFFLNGFQMKGVIEEFDKYVCRKLKFSRQTTLDLQTCDQHLYSRN